MLDEFSKAHLSQMKNQANWNSLRKKKKIDREESSREAPSRLPGTCAWLSSRGGGLKNKEFAGAGGGG